MSTDDSTDDSGISLQIPGPVLAALTDLKESFDSKIRYDEAKERQITALHEELESYRQGSYQRILRPLLTDVIGVYDEVASQVADESEDAERDSEETKREHKRPERESLLQTIEIVLERYGVTRYTCEKDGVDRSRQRVIEAIPTSDQALDRRLARRLRAGFEIDGKVLRPEWIAAYRYVPDGEPGG